MNRFEEPTYKANIYIGGDLADARRICRQHCNDVGLCVTLEPVEFVYTGGLETGVRVGLINYPRFPATQAAIFQTAEELALLLIEGLHQQSASIVATDRTVWLTKREATSPAIPIPSSREETVDG
jgi:hypothetical protein